MILLTLQYIATSATGQANERSESCISLYKVPAMRSCFTANSPPNVMDKLGERADDHGEACPNKFFCPNSRHALPFETQRSKPTRTAIRLGSANSSTMILGVRSIVPTRLGSYDWLFQACNVRVQRISTYPISAFAVSLTGKQGLSGRECECTVTLCISSPGQEVSSRSGPAKCCTTCPACASPVFPPLAVSGLPAHLRAHLQAHSWVS